MTEQTPQERLAEQAHYILSGKFPDITMRQCMVLSLAILESDVIREMREAANKHVRLAELMAEGVEKGFFDQEANDE